MSKVLACVLGTLVLLSGCSSGGRQDEGPTPEKVKASVDDLATKILPALAKALDGEFPLAQGRFIGCGAGPEVKRYVASGELHAEVPDNAAAAREIRATLADAGVKASLERDSKVRAETGDLTIVVEPSVVAPNSVVAIRPLAVASRCHPFSKADLERISRIKPKVYGKPVTGAS